MFGSFTGSNGNLVAGEAFQLLQSQRHFQLRQTGVQCAPKALLDSAQTVFDRVPGDVQRR